MSRTGGFDYFVADAVLQMGAEPIFNADVKENKLVTTQNSVKIERVYPKWRLQLRLRLHMYHTNV
jgi:hypothetical protein